MRAISPSRLWSWSWKKKIEPCRLTARRKRKGAFMKILVLISRFLLGLVFVVFGLNGFLHFIPAQMPPGLAGQFAGAMHQSHYDLVVSAIQVIGGVLLLVNRYLPPRPYASRTGDCQYSAVSRTSLPAGTGYRRRCRRALVHPVLPISRVLLGLVRTAGLLTAGRPEYQRSFRITHSCLGGI